jgi:ketosteroid isomerase-like protein
MMRVALTITVIITCTPFAILAAQEPLPVDSALVATVRARETAFAATMQDRNFAAFASFLDDGAVFFSGPRALRGKATISAAWRRFFDGPAPFSWAPDLVEVVPRGDLALTSGPVLDPDGKQIGRFNSVWRRDAKGTWHVVIDRGDPPPPTP